MDLKNIKMVVVIVLILIGVYIAYSYFMGGSSPAVDGLAVDSGEGTDLANTSGTDYPFLDLLAGLNSVDLKERSLLSDPIFKEKMQDFGQALPTPDIGRDNPFLPVGTNAGGALISASINTASNNATNTNNTSTDTDAAANISEDLPGI